MADAIKFSIHSSDENNSSGSGVMKLRPSETIISSMDCYNRISNTAITNETNNNNNNNTNRTKATIRPAATIVKDGLSSTMKRTEKSSTMINQNQIPQVSTNNNNSEISRSALPSLFRKCLNGFVVLNKNVYEWTVQDVAKWLEINDFGSYVNLFCDQHRIDGRVLIHLTADDLRSEPLKLTIFGDIKRFCLAFDHLRSIHHNPNINNSTMDYYPHYQRQPFHQQQSNKDGSSSTNVTTIGHQSLNRHLIKEKIAINNNNVTRSKHPKNLKYSTNNNHSDKSSCESRSSCHNLDDEHEDLDFDNNQETDVDIDGNGDSDGDIERIHTDNDFEQQRTANFIFSSTNEIELSALSCSSSASSLTSTSPSVSSGSDQNKFDDEEQQPMSLNSNNSAGNNSNNNVKYIQNRNPSITTRIIPTVTSGSELANMIASTHPGHSSLTGLHQPRGLKTQAIQLPKSMPFIVSSSKKYSSHQRQQNYRYNHSYQHHHSYHRHHHHHHHHHHRKELKPEAWKAIVALIYFFSSTWITAIVMVIVHDRVPDMDTYPPLPDLILDNLPLIPWAFGMAETCGLILFIIWALILIFHKHRFILLRRMFSLFGSVFLIRCFTMVITSLSVPGRHLQCKARPYGTWTERLHQAYMIWQGGGMAIQGVRTCGDYMFSGHTVVLTMLNFFITEYTPPSLYLIHTMSWVLNLFGVFFILAAHEHYSIDVFIAFYISTRLFLYYHTLANNRALYQRDRHRTRIWFPLFSFFESGVSGIVPNEYEIPFRRLKDRFINYLASKFVLIPLIRVIFDQDDDDDDWGCVQDIQHDSTISNLPYGASSSTTTSTNKLKTQ